MPFELLPIINIMQQLYSKPLNPERFNAYLQILQGDTDNDLAVPVSGFNPMAKQHVNEKLNHLKEIKAEKIIAETLDELNHKTSVKETFRVALNLADDLKGGWTNRFTSDFQSKFEINALIKRKFSVVLLWTGEEHNEELIRERTKESCYRTIYAMNHSRPVTLEDHVLQEKFAAVESKKETLQDPGFAAEYYRKNRNSDNYHLIFNFMYGDEASESLGFTSYGIKQKGCGFIYAKYLNQ